MCGNLYCSSHKILRMRYKVTIVMISENEKNMITRLREWHTAGFEPATGLFLANDRNQLDEVAVPPSWRLQAKSNIIIVHVV